MEMIGEILGWRDLDLPSHLVHDTQVAAVITRRAVVIHQRSNRDCFDRLMATEYGTLGQLLDRAVEVGTDDQGHVSVCGPCASRDSDLDALSDNLRAFRSAAAALQSIELVRRHSGREDFPHSAWRLKAVATHLLNCRRRLDMPALFPGLSPEWEQIATAGGDLAPWWAERVPVWKVEMEDVRARCRATNPAWGGPMQLVMPREVRAFWSLPVGESLPLVAFADVVDQSTRRTAAGSHVVFPVVAIPADHELTDPSWVSLGPDRGREHRAGLLAALSTVASDDGELTDDLVQALATALD